VETDLQQVLLLAQVRSMTILLNEKLGDANPWRSIQFDAYSSMDLAYVKKLMHELLYAPPPRT